MDEESFFILPDDVINKLIPEYGPFYKFLVERQKLKTPVQAAPAKAEPKHLYTPGTKLRALLRRDNSGIAFLKRASLLSVENDFATWLIGQLTSKTVK